MKKFSSDEQKNEREKGANQRSNNLRQWLNRRGLRFNLLFLVIGVSLAVTLTLSVTLYYFQNQQLLSNAQSGMMMVSNTFESNLRHAMLSRDVSMMESLIQDIAKEPRVESLQLLNDQGVVKFGSDQSMQNQQIPLTDAQCQLCHQTGDPATNKSFVFTTDSGHEVLLNVNLIENEPVCYECHEPENKILGLLLFEMSMASIYDQFTASFWRTALIVISALILLLLLIIPALEKRIIRPVKALSKGMADVSDGNFDYQVKPVYQDELGDLAMSFDRMRDQLKSTLTQRDQRENELAILYRVGQTAAQLHDLQAIMDFTLTTIVSGLGMADSLIFLLDESEQRYMLRAYDGITPQQVEILEERRRSGFDFIQQVAESQKELFIPNLDLDKRVEWIWNDLKERSYISFPLISHGKVVGVMETITQSGHILTSNEVEFLKAVGQQIGTAIDNELLLEVARQNELESTTLYRFGITISKSLALRDVLNAVAESARELVHADIGLASLFEEDSREVEIRAAAGLRSARLIGKRRMINEEYGGTDLLKGKALFSHLRSRENLNRINQNLSPEDQIIDYLTVPMMRGEHFVGCIEVLSHQSRRFTKREAQVLERLGYHVVVTIENAMLYNQMRYMAALEEQGRLARELHDHLAQSVGFLNVKASITENLLANHKIDEARESLKELKRVAKNVFIDVREGVFNLRTAASTRIGLLPTLQEYLNEYRDTYHLDVQLSVEGNEPFEFAAEIANQLLRVIQEALTNIRKHSQTNKARVHCTYGNQVAQFVIEDDGIGFELGAISQKNGQHFGLQIMRERIFSVGGTLEYDSSPGKGTRIIIEIPMMNQD